MDGVSHTEAMSALYEQDCSAWALDRAARLREAAKDGPAGLDWENLAEQIAALGRSDQRAITSHIRTIASHIMKLEASPATQPRAAWRQSVIHARGEIDQFLSDSPSLRSAVADLVAREMPSARWGVAALLTDHGEAPLVPLESLSYSPEQITRDWWPA